MFFEGLFMQKLSPELVTIILNDLAVFPVLKDTLGYLAVRLELKMMKLDML